MAFKKEGQISKETADVIAEKAVKMVATCVKYKEPRLKQIQQSLDIYLNVEKPALKGYSNIPIDYVVMTGFVDTLMSKIDDAPSVQFSNKTEADLKRAKKYTAFWENDSSSVREKWNAKDRNEKKQAIFEGVGISKFYSENTPKYKSNLENVSLQDYIFEPSGGAYIQKHRFNGQENIFKSLSDIKEEVASKNYSAVQVRELKNKTNSDETKHNEDLYTSRYTRQKAMGLDVESNMYLGESIFSLTELFLWHDGKKYQIVFDYKTGVWVKIKLMKDVFASELYPYSVWQTENNFQSLLCPAPADVIRPIAVSMKELFNDGMMNLKKNNDVMRVIDSTMINNINQLKWRKNGIVVANTQNGRTLDHAVKNLEVPDRTDLIVNLTDWLDNFIGQKTGITASAQGTTDKNAKVGIYYGDLQQVADRMGLLNKSYSEAWEDKALLWVNGVDEHLSEPEAVKIVGATGIEWDELNKEDVSLDKELDIKITGGNAEEQLNEVKQKKKEEALSLVLTSDLITSINPKWAIEQLLRSANYDESDIKNATDTKNYGDQEIMAEAADENEKIVSGEEVKPNRGATMGHIRKHIDFADNMELEQDIYKAILAHVDSEMEYAEKNLARELDSGTNEPPAEGAVPPPGGANPALPGGNAPATARRSANATDQLTPQG